MKKVKDRRIEPLKRGEEMKTVLRICTLSLIIVNASCSSGNKVVEELQERNGISFALNSEKPFTGTQVKKYANGQKLLEINYRDGKPHGLVTSWYENGQKEGQGKVRDGKGHGLLTKWYENGQKKKEGNFKADTEHGLGTEWYENGQKKLVGNFKDGVLHGLVTKWSENGQIVREREWVNGIPVY